MIQMIEVSVHQAKTHLSRLLRRIAAGEEVTILRSGTPVARLVSHGARGRRKLGLDAGKVRIGVDFDDPVEADRRRSGEG